MRYPLTSLPSVTPEEERWLAAAGIEDTDELLLRLGHRSWAGVGPTHLGIEVGRLAELLCVADLVRVKGVGPSWAEALAATGIRNVQDLARRSPAELAEAVRGGRSRAPGKAELEEIISEAAELRERLSRRPDVARDFMDFIEDKQSTESAAGQRIDGALALLVMVALFAAFLGVGGVRALSAPAGVTADAGTAAQHVQMLLAAHRRAVLSSLLSATVSVGAMGLIAGWIWSRVGRALLLHGLPRFLVRDADRLAYQTFSEAVTLRTTTRWLWAAVALVALLVGVWLVFLLSAESTGQALEWMIGAAMLAAPLVAGVALLPHFRRMAAASRSGAHAWSSLWRVAQWQFLHVFVGLAFLLAVLRVLLPMALTAHDAVVREGIVPRLQATSDATLAKLEPSAYAEAVDSVAAREAMQALRLEVDGWVARAGRPVRELLLVEGTDRTVLDAAAPIVVAWCAWAALFGFFLPFAYKHPGRGAFYLGVIAAATLLETLLATGLRAWLGPGAGPLGAFVVIAFVILATEFGIGSVADADLTERA